MSGAAAAGGEGGLHGLYGEDPTAGFFNPFDHDDVDSFFLRRSPGAAGEGGGSGGDGLAAYSSSITDYLQGFLQDDDGVVKQEMVVQEAVNGHDADQLGGASVTPNSSSSGAVCGEETRRRCKKGTPEEEEEENDDEDEEGSAADRNCKSYYRCTAARCGVKKLVERSQQDPSSVITTYEGQHTHPSPVGLGGRAGTMRAFMQPLLQQQQQLGLLRPDDLAARAMVMSHLGYGDHGARVPGSSLLPAGNGMRSPMSTHLLQQEPRASSPLVPAYGGAPGFVPPAAMVDVKAHERC
ncbi:hypothetical protein EJB05_36320 [Eragrostis curvula]|uniref:WRKY domain-containing protein n=1 Tax=Eragrostis curvula TaxID=38414 RepID=A0A5J9U9W5_9POAL|nr:hypothetical protein EJB05_36320 [Eragrostis curvula]